MSYTVITAPRSTFFKHNTTLKTREAKVLQGEALLVDQSLLSGDYKHATLPAVPFGEEADSMTDAVLVVRFSLLKGSSFAEAVAALW